ncbi:MAG: hypothetical protein KAS07_03720 [Candidatus Pacebacteria bacterium]|nr:hypothetical protein [Candidatus Paceibacterota bacterium]
MTKKQIIILTLSAVFVVVLLLGMQRNASSSVLEGVAQRNSIEISDQKAGNKVIVSGVSLTEGGFIIIHEDVLDFPMDILGISDHIQPGKYSDITVFLGEKSVSGESMFAVLHEDDEDGVFNPEYDYSILDADSKIVMSKFLIK